MRDRHVQIRFAREAAGAGLGAGGGVRQASSVSRADPGRLSAGEQRDGHRHGADGRRRGGGRVVAGINTDIARLKQLDVVNVGGLVVTGPEASSCYVHPCGGRGTGLRRWPRTTPGRRPGWRRSTDMGEAIAARVAPSSPPATDTSGRPRGACRRSRSSSVGPGHARAADDGELLRAALPGRHRRASGREPAARGGASTRWRSRPPRGTPGAVTGGAAIPGRSPALGRGLGRGPRSPLGRAGRLRHRRDRARPARRPGCAPSSRRQGGRFDHVFFSWQPRDRGRLRLDDYAPAWDDLFASRCPPACRARSTTPRSTWRRSSAAPGGRGELLDFTNALCARYGIGWINEDVGLLVARRAAAPVSACRRCSTRRGCAPACATCASASAGPGRAARARVPRVRGGRQPGAGRPGRVRLLPGARRGDRRAGHARRRAPAVLALVARLARRRALRRARAAAARVLLRAAPLRLRDHRAIGSSTRTTAGCSTSSSRCSSGCCRFAPTCARSPSRIRASTRTARWSRTAPAAWRASRRSSVPGRASRRARMRCRPRRRRPIGARTGPTPPPSTARQRVRRAGRETLLARPHRGSGPSGLRWALYATREARRAPPGATTRSGRRRSTRSMPRRSRRWRAAVRAWSGSAATAAPGASADAVPARDSRAGVARTPRTSSSTSSSPASSRRRPPPAGGRRPGVESGRLPRGLLRGVPARGGDRGRGRPCEEELLLGAAARRSRSRPAPSFRPPSEVRRVPAAGSPSPARAADAARRGRQGLPARGGHPGHRRPSSTGRRPRGRRPARGDRCRRRRRRAAPRGDGSPRRRDNRG